MAQFQYRLQILLDLKVQRKTELERALAQRQRELAAEQKELVELEQAQENLERTLEQARQQRLETGTGVNGYTLRLRTEHLRGLIADVEAGQGAVSMQRLRVGEFQDRVAQARRSLAEAAREVEILEKHRERLEKRFQKSLEQQEALAQDEMGGVIFTQRRRAV